MKQKLLYVDDESINLDLLKLTFRKEYEVITALSAEEGLSILEKDHDIRVVISDLKMPNVDGMAFIKSIKRRDKDIVCLLLTGYIESEVMLEGFNKELIFRYIVKPWKKEELRINLEEALAQTNHR